MDATPKHIIAVSANVTNDKGETLLVKTHIQSDTWETPGGQVEVGSLLMKLCAEKYWKKLELLFHLLV